VGEKRKSIIPSYHRVVCLGLAFLLELFVPCLGPFNPCCASLKTSSVRPESVELPVGGDRRRLAGHSSTSRNPKPATGLETSSFPTEVLVFLLFSPRPIIWRAYCRSRRPGAIPPNQPPVGLYNRIPDRWSRSATSSSIH